MREHQGTGLGLAIVRDLTLSWAVRSPWRASSDGEVHFGPHPSAASLLSKVRRQSRL